MFVLWCNAHNVIDSSPVHSIRTNFTEALKKTVHISMHLLSSFTRLNDAIFNNSPLKNEDLF